MEIKTKKEYKLACRIYELVSEIQTLDPSPENDKEFWYWVGVISDYNNYETEWKGGHAYGERK